MSKKLKSHIPNVHIMYCWPKITPEIVVCLDGFGLREI